MPRVGREQSGTGIYHVMLRGINRQDIFEEPEDYWTFIKILSHETRTRFLFHGVFSLAEPSVSLSFERQFILYIF